MRSFFYVMTAVMVIALAFWAYRENYETQAALSRSEAVQQKIADQRQRLRVLNAEWAYLNRPDRLRDLVEINFDQLGLLPFQPYQFGKIDQVAYPSEGPLPISNVIDVMEREQQP
ncbi:MULTISPECIES: cell division protein FtsL [unclassified Roseovarius]|uniref:cell division protein FtsL n=1 Tax=unclassified Roseovarius TaxID=2614913 RepID=UPI00273DE58F|nr:cell division protein FtsL [Roseovarius sp. MMSF_3350]